MRINLTCALLVFVIAFVLRIPLVDKDYRYSFEPDSESCVEVTRSFYFFFKSPSKENFPQTLGVYPNYSDGSFISSAIVANVVRPLCKAGIIKANLSNGDNSLVIFSMRWASVLFDALSAALAFFIFVLISGSSFTSLLIVLLYYLLNQQTLNIDLSRIDHFGLFVANLAMLAAVLFFRFPTKKGYYILCGIAAGLVTGTKINFPFYLLILAFVFCHLLWKKKISLRNFTLLAISFLLSTAFMYQRWLMYPENIWEVIAFTFNNGKVWTEFWGIDNCNYYLWDEFFNHGYSFGVAVLLIAGYASFILCLFSDITKRDAFKLILCTTFILQSVALIFSPKVGRYGIIMPLWMGVFLAYGITAILQSFGDIVIKRIGQLAFALFLLPVFFYSLTDYRDLKEKNAQRDISIIQTRIDPYQWIANNIPAGSVCAVQHPRVSNPPVFELPFVFEEKYLACPFLYKDKLASFFPPDVETLKQNVNYIITSDKETDYHFSMLKWHHCDSSLIVKWQQFYHSLDTLFPHQDFSSAYNNYGVKSIHVYELNKTPLARAPVITDCKTVSDNRVSLNWDVVYGAPSNEYGFQIQVARDSAFRWLVSGSRDGFPSRYRAQGDPVFDGTSGPSFVPPKIREALLSGKFNNMLHGDDPHSVRVQLGMETFFRRTLVHMVDSGVTFRESVTHLMEENEAMRLIRFIDTVYNGNCPFWYGDVQTYIKLAGINADAFGAINHSFAAAFSYRPLVKFAKDKKYYWRVRLRNRYNVMSRWSEPGVISL